MQTSEKYRKVHKCHILFQPWPLILGDICWVVIHVHFIKIPNKCFLLFFVKCCNMSWLLEIIQFKISRFGPFLHMSKQWFPGGSTKGQMWGQRSIWGHFWKYEPCTFTMNIWLIQVIKGVWVQYWLVFWCFCKIKCCEKWGFTILWMKVKL